MSIAEIQETIDRLEARAELLRLRETTDALRREQDRWFDVPDRHIVVAAQLDAWDEPTLVQVAS